MRTGVLGIHHITAIAGDVQQNIDFYTGFLGLRLVKKTVNFDDPGVYHLYYGDDVGSPGTIMTFFPFGEGSRGRKGTGQATRISFSIPKRSVEFWVQRLSDNNMSVIGPESRFAEQVIVLRDPDGIELELVTHDGAEDRPGWTKGPVPPEHAIRGFHSVTISVKDHQPTAQLLTETMGFRLLQQDGQRFRYAVGKGGAGTIIDVLRQPNVPYGAQAIGSIHHIAWRVASRDALMSWQLKLTTSGRHVTEIKDRNYFLSVYFREPGGVLFELATDPPGFAIDESVEHLGTDLKLPEWLEPHRARLETQLPPIQPPAMKR